MNKIQSPDAFERIMISAKLDIPVELTVRAIVFSGWALGQYTHEIMILIFGPVFDAVLDLLEEQEKLNRDDVALIRIEQLFPLPVVALKSIIKKFNNKNSTL